MSKRPAYPNHVGTIGGTIRMGHGLWVHCENRECLHRARIDLEEIAERYGAEPSVAEFVNRSVCSECNRGAPCGQRPSRLLKLSGRGRILCDGFCRRQSGSAWVIRPLASSWQATEGFTSPP
jgi:hypothetical protein